jgi:hypothetical protein
MALKWAIVDLIRLFDVAHEGRLHGDLSRIARTLGVELGEPATLAVRPELPFGQARKARSSAVAGAGGHGCRRTAGALPTTRRPPVTEGRICMAYFVGGKRIRAQWICQEAARLAAALTARRSGGERSSGASCGRGSGGHG